MAWMIGIPLFVMAAGLGNAEAKRIYIGPDDHTDYMWSGNEETYRQAFLEMIDYYLDLADKTAGNRPEHRSRWTCDGTYWLWTYERNRTAKEFARLVERIKDGSIHVPMNALVSCYGGMPAEAVLRGMLYAGDLEKRYGIRLPMAIAMENQTLPHGLGALWAGAGAKYSWKGICGCASKLRGQEPRGREIYWWKGTDGSRLLMKWNSLITDNKWMGGYAEARDPAKAIEMATTDPRFQRLWRYPLIGIFGKGWDDLKTLSDEFVRVAQEKSTLERMVVVSNQKDFFEEFEQRYGKEIPEFNAAFGNEWDLYSASMPEVSARVRRAVERLRTAEAIATLVSWKRPEFLNGRKEAREQAWINLGLYWEHNWTADGRVLTREARAAWQRRLASGVEQYVDGLAGDAREALGTMIVRTGTLPRFYVFNSLGWSRTGAADLLYAGPEDVRVVDLAAGREVASQMVLLEDAEFQRPRRHLRLWAEDVPAVGYKVYEIRPGRGGTIAPAAQAKDGWLENAAYRMKVADRGAITSFVDKTRGGRELAREVDGLWMNDLGAGGGVLAVENAGPVSMTLRAKGSSPLRHTTRVTLYRGSNRVDIDNEINENFEGVRSWGFGFNINRPEVWHEEVGAVLRARLLEDGGHYSRNNSRLEWLTLNHFAAMSEEGGPGVTLSNRDCAFFRLGSSGIENGSTLLDTNTSRMDVLAGGQVDGPRLGIPMQGGDSRLVQRFALQAHERFEARAAMRFALEHQNPLVTGAVRGGVEYPEAEYSAVSMKNANVLLWALKPAEEGMSRGVVVRLWNMSGEAQDAGVEFRWPVREAWTATHTERDTGSARIVGSRLEARLDGTAMRTYRVAVGKE
jgi:alpha-mannosidase